MEDIYDIVKNIEGIYDNNTSFQVLKDFERVIDELDIYVYKNWEDGELASGPKIDRHWVTCSFMWDREKMPDPMGGKRLLDYDCKVYMGKDYVIKPRKIRSADDIRPGTKKGKLDKKAIWIVTIQMPKKLIADIYGGSSTLEQLNDITATEVAQPADEQAEVAADAPVAEPGVV
tara:strand:- start:114 stop:635 length:522 start_codon:yes stop_codon:yes gene_type:complete